MKRRLFLTGPIGCGKSTAIWEALGDRRLLCGGFMTRRHREPHLHFTLERPDGTGRVTFLDCGPDGPRWYPEAFAHISLAGSVLVLDEIGGIELLCPEFAAALDALLNRDTPVLGILKGDAAASAMIRKLGLTEDYETAATALRHRLTNDEDTLVYPCGQFDETAHCLAKQWVKEYAHD